MEHSEAITRFLQMLQIDRGASRHTIVAYTSDIENFLYSFSHVPLSSITSEHVKDYLSCLDWMNKNSVRRIVSSLRHFFRFLLDEKVLEKSPMDGVSLPKRDLILPKILTETEVQKILEYTYNLKTATSLKYQTIVELLYATGMRVSELISLTRYSPVFEKGLIKVCGKRDRERFVLMHKDASALLLKYMESLPQDAVFLFASPRDRQKPMTRQAIFLLLKKMALNVGIDKSRISPHVLRHAFASHLLGRGVDLFLIKEMMGHQSVSSTQVYTHVLPQKLHEVLHKHHPLYKEGFKSLRS